MPSVNFVMPFRPAFDSNAVSISGALAWFTLTGTNTPAPVYADAALTVPRMNPVVSNAAGRFPQTFLDDTLVYRVRIFDADADVTTATPIESYDPYTPSETGSQGVKGDPGGSAPAIGLMTALSGLTIPAGDDRITTTGHSAIGRGGISLRRMAAGEADPPAALLGYLWGRDLTNARFVLDEPIVPIEACGAKADGADDGPAFVRAMTAIAHFRLPVHGRQGATYSVGSANWTGITLGDVAQARLIGNGARIRLLAAPTQTISIGGHRAIIKLTSVGKALVHGWNFDLNNIAGVCIAADLCGLDVQGCDFTGHNGGDVFGLIAGYAYGLHAVRCTGTLANNTATAISYMFYCGHTNTGLHCTQLTVTGNRAISLAADFLVGVFKQTVIQGNYVDGCFVAVALAGYNVFGAFCKDVTVTGNVFLNCLANGVQIGDVVNQAGTAQVFSQDVAVIGNVISTATTAARAISAYHSTRFVVVGNTALSACLVHCDNASLGTISGNRLVQSVGSTVAGISLVSTVGDVTRIDCSDNSLIGAGAGTYGILVHQLGGFSTFGVSIRGGLVAGTEHGVMVLGGSSHSIGGGLDCRGNSGTDIIVNVDDCAIGDVLYLTEQGVASRDLALNSATPAVYHRRKWRAENSAATAITNFVGGVSGTRLQIYSTNANTTINQTGNILNGAFGNIAIPSNGRIEYEKVGAIWFLASKSF